MHFSVFASLKVEASIDKGDSQLTYMLVKPLQPEKADLPIEVTLEGRVRLAKLLQPLKADSPIEVTLEGRVRLVKPLQPEKAKLPIEETLEGRVRLVKPLQYANLLLIDYQYYTL